MFRKKNVLKKSLGFLLITSILVSVIISVMVTANADTTHFKSSEFKCKCCGKLPSGGISQDLMNKLEVLRSKLGNRKITIVSGYRCPSHNKAVGGAKNSQHLYGRAADIIVEGVAPSTVANAAESIFSNGGLGRYKTFTHVDVRGYKARW